MRTCHPSQSPTTQTFLAPGAEISNHSVGCTTRKLFKCPCTANVHAAPTTVSKLGCAFGETC